MIAFRNLLKSDFESLKAFVGDKRVTRYLTWESYTEDKKVINFLDKAGECTEFPNEYLAVIYKQRLIGTVHLISRGNGYIQFGFGITPPYWGKGIGNEIVKKAINYIKTSSWLENAVEIWADTHQENIHAKKILLKNKFSYNGLISQESNRERYILVCKNHYNKNS